MTQAKILTVGLGDLGGRIAQSTQAAFPSAQVVGMRRGEGTPAGISLLRHDAAEPWKDAWAEPSTLQGLTDVVLCISPGGRTIEAYQQAYLKVAHQSYAWLQRHAPQAHLWLVSSTGVYGQQHGEWVDEESATEPESPTAQVLVETEQFWLHSAQPATIVRPAGIYGPGREYMFRQAREGFTIADPEPIYTNRIHIDDAARAVVHLMQRRVQGLPVADRYNLTDKDPATLQEVLTWLQQRFGVTPTEQRTLNRGSKRISNQRLLDTGFTLRYPSFREGYEAM
ncbi:SDR family oxidoreductase [Salinispirillum sp. LH 10-3-1]|uniref:SDR family oxidoreductase n=1 Tax=Salinispirillum sp. LH 10-3-1 TaxID=2952525 RepID=A0AB38YJP3_9GAMM